MEAATVTQSLSSRIVKTENIRWKELKFVQQEEFKEWFDSGDEKLQKSLLKYQFVDPFKVWQAGPDEMYCLDGFHRYQDLAALERSGITVPEELPATFIDCEDINDAAQLVLVYSSIYAKITQVGLHDFISKYNLDIIQMSDTINIPEFSMDRHIQKFDLHGVNDAEEPEVIIGEADIIVKEGDLFEINGHRIICGSFMEPGVQSSLMDGKKGRIVNCDPPYNLPANFFTNKDEKRHEDFAMGAGEMTDEEFSFFLECIMRASVAHTVEGGIHYIFMDWRHSWHMTDAAKRVYGSPIPKQLCVWNKDLYANGSFYRSQHELCFIFNSPQAKALWNKDLLDEGGFYKENDELVFIFKNGDGAKHLSHLDLKDRIRSNVWRYPSATSIANHDRFELKNHPTPKPVVMIADAIMDTTNEGDIVIDWFLGSGTTLLASDKTCRICYGSDIKPKYIQQIIQRYINYCEKRNIDINFKHLTGTLTLKDFKHGKSVPSEKGLPLFFKPSLL